MARYDKLPDPMPCPWCKAIPDLVTHCYAGWMMVCNNCYDGAPDSPSRHDYGSGPTERQAIEDWNEKMRDAVH